jgi:acyl carrier protein
MNDDRICIKSQLQSIFRDFFDDNSITISEATTAQDVDGWDSLTNVNLMFAVEKTFKITLSARDVKSLKNIEGLIDLIMAKSAV